MIGKEITVQRWYRRSPMQYIEINNFTVENKTRRSYLWVFRYLTGFVITTIGIIMLAELV